MGMLEENRPAMATVVEEERPAGVPYEVAVAVLIAVPFYLTVKVFAEAIPGILGPAGLPLVALGLVLLIHFLSADRGAAALSHAPSGAGFPDTFYRAAGSPVGLVLLLLLLLFLIYVKASLLGGNEYS